MNEPQALIKPPGGDWADALRAAAALWAETSTEITSARRDDLRREKKRAVASFFSFTGKRPGEVGPEDVRAWQEKMEEAGLSANTIYTRLSFLSSFYQWAASHAPPGEIIRGNPVRLARPKRPRPYQSEATKALSDEEVRSLVGVIRSKAEAGSLVAKRDLALLLWYLLTGMRRAEVIGLRGRDLELKEDAIIVRGRVKGGTYVGREIRDPDLRSALEDYLLMSQRLHVIKADGPLWTRHDLGGRPGEPLTSYAFVRNLKLYAQEAGLRHIHLHQTRHTYARIVSEETGSLLETQEALGHQSPATTRVYVQRIAVKKDKHSARVARRLRQS